MLLLQFFFWFFQMFIFKIFFIYQSLTRMSFIQMDLKDSLSRFKQQQERCQSSLASIAANQALTSKPKHRAQPINAPSVPARPSQPIKFSNDTERLQHINSIRKSPVGAQMKLVIELLYKVLLSFNLLPFPFQHLSYFVREYFPYFLASQSLIDSANQHSNCFCGINYR